MAIRVQHQGAGAGAGIDDGFKRKYDMRMRQQEKVQDRMFQVGLQNRNVALQRENMVIGDNLQANQRRQARQDAQADLQQQQEFQAERDAANFDRQKNMRRVAAVQDRLDRQQQADLGREEWNRRRNVTAEENRLEQDRIMRLNRAMQRSDLETGMELGEFDEITSKKLKETFAAEDEILSNEQMDPTQRDEALAKLNARRLRISQNRRDSVSMPQPATARQAFDMNPDLEDRLTKQAMEQLQSQYKMQAEAHELDPTKPAPAIPTYEDALNMAGQMWDQRQKFGQQPAAQGQMPGGAGLNGMPPGAPPATGQSPPPAAQVPQDPAARWSSMGMPPLPDPEWGKMISKSPAMEEDLTNLQFHTSSLPPEIKNAFNYAMQPVNSPGSAEANQYLQSSGFDLELMAKIPQAPRMDWLSVASARSSDDRPKVTAMRKFSESQPADIQNAIALVMNPKTSPEAKKKATAHLMNRGVATQIDEILGSQ